MPGLKNKEISKIPEATSCSLSVTTPAPVEIYSLDLLTEPYWKLHITGIKWTHYFVSVFSDSGLHLWACVSCIYSLQSLITVSCFTVWVYPSVFMHSSAEGQLWGIINKCCLPGSVFRYVIHLYYTSSHM